MRAAQSLDRPVAGATGNILQRELKYCTMFEFFADDVAGLTWNAVMQCLYACVCAWQWCACQCW